MANGEQQGSNKDYDKTDIHPPLEVSFTVEPSLIPRLIAKLEEYNKRDTEYTHPEASVVIGGAKELYKPLVLAAILDLIHENPDTTITMIDIAKIVSSAGPFDVTPAVAPCIWSDVHTNYVPDDVTILKNYTEIGADRTTILAGLGFASAYVIISDYASGGRYPFIKPGKGTGLPQL